MPPYSKPGTTRLTREITKAAGAEMEKEFTKQFPMGLDISDVVSTRGYNIPNVKSVYFGALPKFAVKERDEHLQVKIKQII